MGILPSDTNLDGLDLPINMREVQKSRLPDSPAKQYGSAWQWRRAKPKVYGECPKKRASRAFTIVDTYREFIGLDRLPERKQYWTLCAAHVENEKAVEGAELFQIARSGLIKMRQFHGVDINRSVISCKGNDSRHGYK